MGVVLLLICVGTFSVFYMYLSTQSFDDENSSRQFLPENSSRPFSSENSNRQFSPENSSYQFSSESHNNGHHYGQFKTSNGKHSEVLTIQLSESYRDPPSFSILPMITLVYIFCNKHC